MLFQVLGVRWC